MATKIWWHQYASLQGRRSRCIVYHHAESQAEARYPKSGIVTYGRTPPFSLLIFLRFRMLKILRYFQTFRLFNLPTMDLPFSPFPHPNFNRPSLVASYALSDAPEPLFTSVLCGRCRIYRCRQILTSGEESLASWNSVPGNPLLLLATFVTYGNCGLWGILLADGMRNAHRQWGHCFSLFFVGILSRYRCAIASGCRRPSQCRAIVGPSAHIFASSRTVESSFLLYYIKLIYILFIHRLMAGSMSDFMIINKIKVS